MDPRTTTTRQGNDRPHASGHAAVAPSEHHGTGTQSPFPATAAASGTDAASFSPPYIKRPDAGLSITTATSPASTFVPSATSSLAAPFAGFDLRPPRVHSATTTPSTAPTSATSIILPPLNPNQYPSSSSSGSKNRLPRTPHLTIQQSPRPGDEHPQLSLFNMDPKNDQPASTDSSDDEPYEAWPRVESWGYTKYNPDSSDDGSTSEKK